jgi:Zn-dependent peptidase ImmA (M78 family)
MIKNELVQCMKNEHIDILSKFSGLFPVPVETVANAFGYTVNYSKLDKNILDYKNKIININYLDCKYKQRYTIAKAIGYIINTDNVVNFYTNYTQNINKNNNDKKEIIANQFAMDLLMPKNEFTKLFNELKQLNKSNILIFMNLSSYFGVSEQLVKIRLGAKNF